VSITSCTSPRASASGLPISAVTSRASASAFASTSRPIRSTTRPRTGAGVAAQPRCASRAAVAASTNWSASPSTASPTGSPVAGLTEVSRPPGASSRHLPPM
jgi:hypothetical protein